MKKIFTTLILLLFLIQSCGPSTPQTTQAPPSATQTPSATDTRAPEPALIPPTPSSTPVGLPAMLLPIGWGINLHFMFFPNTYFEPNEGDLLRQSGVQIAKDSMIKENISCNGSECDFFYADRFVRRMTSDGMRVVFLLSDGKPPRTVEERNVFKGFAANAARHFAGKGIIWELWSEPDLDFARPSINDPAEYILMEEETITAMREADPNAIIIGPSVATLDSFFNDNPWRFMQAVGEAGLFSRFDAINVHLYNGSNPESDIQNLLRLRRLIDSFSPDRKIPIVATEWGYTTRGKFYGHQATLDEQTRFTARSYLLHAAHEINMSICYVWKDDSDTSGLPDYEGAFGVIKASAEPKPAYYALKTLMHTLDGFQFVRRIPTQSNKDYLLLFRNGDSGILAAWTTATPHTMAFPRAVGRFESISMLGETEVLESGEQGLALEVTDSPRYVLLPGGFLGDEGIFWKPDGTFFRLDPSGHAGIPLVIENPSLQEQAFEFEVSIDGKNVGVDRVVLKPGETLTANLPVSIDAGLYKSDFVLEITVTNQEITQSARVWLQR
jgi:hypothetical protein